MTKSLTESPRNLKEAIDWILRLTGKDGSNGKKTNDTTIASLARGLKTLLVNIQPQVHDSDTDVFQDVVNALDAESINGKKNTVDYSLIGSLSDGLAAFIGYKNWGKDWEFEKGYGIGYKKVVTSVKPGSVVGISSASGVSASDDEWEDASAYESAVINHVKGKTHYCSKIFLGCIPLIFSGLSYLYWQCNTGRNKKNGGDRWSGDYQKVNDSNTALGLYMVALGYLTTELNKDKNAEKVKTLLEEEFSEFSDLATQNKQGGGNDSAVGKPFSDFIREIKSDFDVPSYPLVCLHLVSTIYFQAQQQRKNPGRDAGHIPCSIREMLYWLMVLPYTPVYHKISRTNLKTLLNKKENLVEFVNGSSQADVINFNVSNAHNLMLSSCFYTGVVLIAIEGELQRDSTSSTFIHDLYANKHFQFYYPDNLHEWFSVLWDVLYAGLFQLNFLNEQCKTCLQIGCGWKFCKYGKEILGGRHLTWICKGNKGNDQPKDVEHDCKTAKCDSSHRNCGENRQTQSPLQAYLCDNLYGFICDKGGDKNLPYTDQANHSPPNQRYPIPMGFNSTNLPPDIYTRTGCELGKMLNDFVDPNIISASLYNLILSVVCVTLRTPRILGDFFGFYFNIGDKDKLSNGLIETSLTTEIGGYPGDHTNSDLVEAVKSLTGRYNGSNGDSHEDDANLYTLRQSNCGSGYTCDQYLTPLTWYIYFNLAKIFAGVYISRIVYLTEHFKAGLEESLEGFSNINCKDSGCQEFNNQTPCKPGDHGEKDICKCTTIVQCRGVLPLLYRFGFMYNSTMWLNGTHEKDPKRGTPESHWKRICNDLYAELSNLLYSGTLFEALLTAINNFLCGIREPFIFFVATFWFTSMAYLAYGMALPLDLLHIRSHWKLASTHILLPIALLSYKKISLSDIGYFKL
ncbi:uncharacterized protein BXIN_0094 [Babesia sp. Xinjiang]|uniref:uncharacterized protein n=1 Tax=Babesia sp. Xinjiang TaxID=462227 RepID=UPI000A24D6E4|nr:uncharacterized protein BXIN_0094 [Babesia sp. Xinjiang]ORM39644.1 hypothetical protein BXIN_0094 [Babesia sp. Xinjiang]